MNHPDATYGALQAARLGDCTPSQLAYWSRAGLVVPAGDPPRYSFRDLVALRVISSLLDAGLSTAKVRRALRYLVEAGDDLAGLRVVTDGDRVWACRNDGEILDALRHGQMALFVAVDRYAAEVDAGVRAFAAERTAFLADLTPPSEPPAVLPV
ncbi:MAG: MerR family transcriptional regulator [Actinomycetia bacterium]|nr:MerR family transcriptional regulator [Actinomycetes bacterium]